ncbi:energy-coupling factor ABC transporter ATP-binding protein [Pelotomaculum isophthalicicum JI]|uniref:Energy-coupling factor ABC transporter ATP-binding protein n=1 Tax=Pelotomaculum isophthalicicum JI TaxID=947010 RepID=A0A9X4H489_9FIRM|nr:ABC transporter ATP-binding protein [Pelotomaculum isophthalicicum]MDF9408553.1 energy-coupling factor ABC transporter ATP-binding protein [Pelotomaculum isophthalicicum JI]
MPDEIFFHLDNVSYNYPGGEEALSGVSMSVKQADKVVLLGANGCGKSTLLKVLDGLLFPQQGVIHSFGEALNEENLSREEFSFAFRRRVGFVFQNSEAQLFNPSVWEEIAFGPVQMGLDNSEVVKRVDHVVTMLGLEHIKDRPPFKLSGGEKKKVAIASVLSINPEVILLDEPTGGLDPRTQTWLINLIKQLNRAGKTLITATHNLDIVEEIADRVMVFSEDHRLVASGTPDEILSNRELLLKVNLVDEKFHQHVHGGGHRHYHAHS